MRRFVRWLAFATAAVTMVACGTAPTGDPYGDPGTPAPPTISTPTIATSGSLVVADPDDGLLEVNVAGFLDALGKAVSDLPPDAFTLVEDGVVQGITVEKIGAGTRAPADVVFVFDTTGSMNFALGSVQSSIIAFADVLDASGLDVRLGAVTFGDMFDTVSSVDSPDRGTSLRGNTPLFWDPQERPTFPLSSDVDAFKSFIDAESPRGGGDDFENALGAVEFAYEDLAWRAGAQRIMVLVTDVCAHSVTTFERFSSSGGYEEHRPPEVDDLIALLRGSATVHVVAPAEECAEFDGVSTEELAGIEGTGGVFFDWNGFDTFDLTTLPFSSASVGGYVITFRGTLDGTEHTVRVVIDDGGDIRGEFTLIATY